MAYSVLFFFLYGEDTYRSFQKLREITDYYKKLHKTGLNLKYYDCQEIDFEEFKDCAQNISMFREKKLIILKNAFSNTEFKEKFLNNIKKIQQIDDVILFYEKNKIKETDSLFKFLKNHGKLQKFDILSGIKLSKWVDKEFEKYSAKIDEKAKHLLISYVNGNLWQLSQEIRKLVCYKKEPEQIPKSFQNKAIKQERPIILSNDVEILVTPIIETNIFKTIDAIAEKNKANAIFLIHKHLKKGDTPLYILSMISFQFRNLLIVKDFMEKHHIYGFPKIPGIHPYVARKTSILAKKFSFEALKKIYYKLFEIDFEIKTGRIDPLLGLDMFIVNM